MSFFKEIVKWVKGWRLDKAFKFNEQGQVTVQNATSKAAKFLGQFITEAESPTAVLIIDLAGDKIEDYFDDVIKLAKKIKSDLEAVVLLEDIPGALKDYRFAVDERTNEFYHSVVNAGIVMLSDGRASIFDAAAIAKIIKDYLDND